MRDGDFMDAWLDWNLDNLKADSPHTCYWAPEIKLTFFSFVARSIILPREATVFRESCFHERDR